MIDDVTIEGIVKLSAINTRNTFMEKEAAGSIIGNFFVNGVKNILKNTPKAYNFARGVYRIGGNIKNSKTVKYGLPAAVVGGMYYFRQPPENPSQAGYQTAGQRAGAFQTVPQTPYKPLGNQGFWYQNQQF